MFLNPSSLKHHVAGANRGRYALNSIALTDRGTLSTDGHALLFVPYPDDDAGDAPKIEGIDPSAAPPEVDPFLVSLPDATKAAAMAGKGSRHAPPITRLLQAEIKGDAITFGANDLSNAQTMRVQRYEGAWPDVGRVIPDYARSVAISLNIDQLLRSIKALRGSTDDDVVTLRIIDDQQAIGMSCKDGTAMLVMPVQVDKPEDHVPCQLRQLRAGHDGPPVAAPPAPEDDGDDLPNESEVVEAEEVYDSLPKLPDDALQPSNLQPTQKRPRRRKRLKAEPASNELATIIGS